MAASHKTKVVAKNISRIALMAEETTKFIAQGYAQAIASFFSFNYSIVGQNKNESADHQHFSSSSSIAVSNFLFNSKFVRFLIVLCVVTCAV